jgi:hypothetical protein
VLRVGEHGSGRAGIRNTLVPKRDHLVQRRRSVAHLTEGLPQNAGKTLPVKGIGTNGTVRVDLVDRWLRHLYKNLGLHVRHQMTSIRVKRVKSGRYEQKFIT